MTTPTEVDNLVMLANASHLVSEILLSIQPGNLTEQYNGNPVTSDTISGIALAAINQEIGDVGNA